MTDIKTLCVSDTAFCKNATMNKWFKFDDHEVYDIGDSDIKVKPLFHVYAKSVLVYNIG